MTLAGDLNIKLPIWMDDARCIDAPIEAFFPEGGQQANYAKAICAGCPVVTTCLSYAIADPTIDGVWGGTTGHERSKIRGRQARAA